MDDAARVQELKDAHNSLMNWGRYVHDAWLDHHLLITPPPIAAQYIAPVVAYDEPEKPRIPLDELDGKLAEHVVVSIGCEPGGFEYFRVLVAWYTNLAFKEITQEERHKRLSKQMHCSFPAAQRMIEQARLMYWDRKKTLDKLYRLCNYTRGK